MASRLAITMALIVSVAGSAVLDITAENADGLLFTSGRGEDTFARSVLLKVFAPWCGYCLALSEPWNETASAFEGSSVTVARLDAQAQPEIAQKLGIQGYPA